VIEVDNVSGITIERFERGDTCRFRITLHKHDSRIALDVSTPHQHLPMRVADGLVQYAATKRLHDALDAWREQGKHLSDSLLSTYERHDSINK